MTIYRGPGGTGDATSDSDTTEFQQFLVQTVAAKDAAVAAQAAAELAENNAEAAEAGVAADALAAASSASSASTSATNSASSATASASSATAAASSASTASTQASNASTSATAAASSATAAASSATAAASSATSASGSASTATTKASEASTSATNAATSASNAATSATNAASSATSASTFSTAAQTAKTAAEAAYDSFDDRYLGPKSADPTVDNDGAALLTGALYWNTAGTVMKVYTGTAWITFNPVNNPVDQTDVGSAPNQIPLNQYLGSLAYQDAANIAGPVRVGGTLTAVGATTLAATSMTSATVTGAVDAGGGVVAEQLVVDNFTASSNAVLRGGATNLMTRSEEFDNAAWTKTNVTVSANTVVAPDGTLTADKVALNTASGFHEILNPFTSVSGTAYTGSYFVKAAEHRFVQLLGPGTVFAEYANFDLVSGTRTAGTSGFGAIQSVGNGWYRISLSATALSASVSARISLALIESGTAGRAASFTGDGFSGIYIWGAQLEAGSSPAAYLKTVATAVSTAYAAPIESPNGLAFPLLSTMTPARNADMTFELTSNTSLVVKVRGSDGTVRSATLTLA